MNDSESWDQYKRLVVQELENRAEGEKDLLDKINKLEVKLEVMAAKYMGVSVISSGLCVAAVVIYELMKK